MKPIRVAAAVLNQTPMDWERNRDHISRAIQEAKSRDVGILCLPEMCIPGYGCDDMFYSPDVQQTCLDVLFELLPETEGIVVSFGLPLQVQKAVFNTCCLVANGEILGFTAKKYLPSDGIHYETRWFRPWPEDQVADVLIEGDEYPVGDIFFNLDGIRIGFEICEDAWVARRPGTELALQGVDIILNPSASHFAFGKTHIRERFVIEGSRAFAVSYVYANLLGNSSGRAIYDGEALIASGGNLLAKGRRFSYDDVLLTEAVIDVDLTRMQQSQQGGYRPDFTNEIGYCVHAERSIPEVEPDAISRPIVEPCADPDEKEQEFTQAVALGLFDYLRKSWSSGFVVSLSGGADSAAVTCLCSLMCDLAIHEIGWEGVHRKLGYIQGVPEMSDVFDLKRRLITTVYQATRNSSDTTRDAAAVVAETAGSQHLCIDVDAIVQQYRDVITDGIGRELTWETDDLTLQNIQARSRGPSVWMLANINNALLLATSNRSEGAVGYTTMDGDTCGGLSPIAGIDKAFLRAWLRWLQTVAFDPIQPWSPLEAVTKLAPTAELRPGAEEQTDEGDLMPYVLLDAIERAAIRDKRSPVEVWSLMRGQFGYDDAQLLVWIERFFKLWSRNQWKRERYAPSFHLDDENLDPKTWCRFPILSGGYRQELQTLRELVASANEK